jgi:hypothetical protein
MGKTATSKPKATLQASLHVTLIVEVSVAVLRGEAYFNRRRTFSSTLLAKRSKPRVRSDSDDCPQR